MRDKQQRAIPAGKKIFQPGDGLDIQVVRRLVEQQQIGSGDKRLSQQHPALHARRQNLEPRLAIEIHPRQNFFHLLLGVPSRFMRIVVGRQPLSNNLRDRSADILRHILRQQRNPRTGSPNNLPRIGRHIAAQDPHQCRLARPVAAEQADFLPRLDLAIDAIQQQRPMESNTDFAESNDRHNREIIRGERNTSVRLVRQLSSIVPSVTMSDSFQL